MASATVVLERPASLAPRRRTARLLDWLRPAPSFLAVGAASTALYGGLYLVLREVATSQWANIVALVLSTLVSTAGNRRLTFHSTAASTVVPHHVLGLGLVVAGLGLTSGALGLLAIVDPTATRVAELVALAVANATIGVVRFAAFSHVMRRDPVAAPAWPMSPGDSAGRSGGARRPPWRRVRCASSSSST